MAQFEIYWDDLTDEAKERLSDLYHGNIDLAPLAIIEVDDEKSEDIEYIKSILKEWGGFTAGDRQLESSPVINSIGDGNVCELAEGFYETHISSIVYHNGNEIEDVDYEYEDLDADVISEIREIVENYENDMKDTWIKHPVMNLS